MSITPYPDAETLLTILGQRIAATLGDELLGLYLYGSLLAGDFDLDTSDIDLLAITTADINDAQFVRLLDMHDQLASDFPAWDGRIEVQYYSADALHHFKTRRSPMVGISPGEPLNRKEAGLDWLLNWYFVLEYGRTLTGPDPNTIIPPISRDEFLQASAREARYWEGWAEQPHDQRGQSYAVLTLCRALTTAKTGERASKLQAARWVQATYPQWWVLVENAVVWRKLADAELDDGSNSWSETAAFVTFVLARIGKTSVVF